MNFLKKVSFLSFLISAFIVCCDEKQKVLSHLLKHKQSGKVYRVIASHAHTIVDGRVVMCLYYVPLVKATSITMHDVKNHGEILYKDVLVSSQEYVSKNFDVLSQEFFSAQSNR